MASLHLFPSLSLGTAFGQGAKALQLMFSYTAKTQRPQYGQLSNKVTYGNRFLMQSGNPDLKPTIIHSVNLTLVRGSWQAVAMMDHYQDGILFWGRSLPDHPSITKISFLNKSFTQLQGILTYAPRFKYWQPRRKEKARQVLSPLVQHGHPSRGLQQAQRLPRLKRRTL